MLVDMNEPFERIEEILNWTLPGLTMYYRDSDLDPNTIKKYKVGKIFRTQTFVDVSNYAGMPTTNCRFIVASSKAAPLFKINPDTEKWGLHSINCNSYFKVLDVYKKERITQVFLIQIPYKGIDFFTSSVLMLGDQDVENQIITKSRESLEKKLQSAIPPALNDQEWIKRTSLPIGLDTNNDFYRLMPTESIPPMAKPLHSAIKKMTNDLTDLNEIAIAERSNGNKNMKTKNGRNRNFWSKLFGN